jgi:hypothetical protein
MAGPCVCRTACTLPGYLARGQSEWMEQAVFQGSSFVFGQQRITLVSFPWFATKATRHSFDPPRCCHTEGCCCPPAAVLPPSTATTNRKRARPTGTSHVAPRFRLSPRLSFRTQASISPPGRASLAARPTRSALLPAGAGPPSRQVRRPGSRSSRSPRSGHPPRTQARQRLSRHFR